MSAEPNQVMQKDTLQPRVGTAQAIGRWIDDHGSGLLPALGAALMTLFGVLLVNPHWYWWLGFAVGCAISILGAALSVRHTDTISRLRYALSLARDQSRVFLITSALTEEWLVLLQHELLDQLRNHNFRAIIFAPWQNFSPREQNRHLREVLMNKDEYASGIVIPIEPELREQELRRFVQEFQKPVVFVDDYPFRSGSGCPQNAGFVGVNSTRGGELAAQAVVDYARHALVRKILVIASNTQRERQLAFKQQILTLLPGCDVVIDEGGLFNRSLAFRESLKHFRQALDSEQPYDVVFCTSDSMTLGCIDAMQAVGDWGSFRPPRIIGYDGLEPVIRQADDTSSLIERVVLQDTHDIAVEATECLIRLLVSRSGGVEWIEPRLYPAIESHPIRMGQAADESETV